MRKSMFGFGGNTEEKMQHLVQKKEWDKLKKKYLYGDVSTRISLAKACKESNSDESVNLLLAILESEEENVKIAALDAIAKVGTDHVTSTLQLLLAKVPEHNVKLREAVLNTLHRIREKK